MPRARPASNPNLRPARAARADRRRARRPVVCSRAVTAVRPIALLAALTVALSGCGGAEAQDENEPEGSFRLEVVEASFPAQQRIADAIKMRITVRNPGSETVPHVAATVETEGRQPGSGPVAFAQSSSDPRLADPNRPVWVLDQEPRGGTSAYANTWTLGSLRPGQTKTFEWQLTPVEPGSYQLSYRVAPGLDGKATLASGTRARGNFEVTISDEPVPARVSDSGEVVRGEEAGAGAD